MSLRYDLKLAYIGCPEICDAKYHGKKVFEKIFAIFHFK